jgi:hypothetical protein
MINPLEILEDMALHAEDERTRVTAAKSLAEYTHQKRPPTGVGLDTQEVNIVMLIGEVDTKQPKQVE